MASELPHRAATIEDWMIDVAHRDELDDIDRRHADDMSRLIAAHEKARAQSIARYQILRTMLHSSAQPTRGAA